MSPPHIDEQRLSAWLDGELDDEQAAEVESWLREHAQDAQRVRQWAADRDALRERLAGELDVEVPEAMRRLVAGHGRQRWAQAAMAAGLLLVGALIGALASWQWQQGRSAELAGGGGWMHRAALAHSVYVPEPRHAVEVKAQEEHLARWLTRRINVPVKLFDLSEQGFELVGGRLLPDGAGKSAQLMYQDTLGQRITVYLRKPDAGTHAAFRYERDGELGMFYWVEAGAGYALVGALPRERLLALAEAIYRQLPAPAAASAAR
jgi:anti-sigma factor RsiW